MKQYADHWANLEDMHLLTRMRIGQFLTNFFETHGYKRDESYKEKDPFYMSDEELLKRFRAFYNGKQAVPEPVNKMDDFIQEVVKAEASRKKTETPPAPVEVKKRKKKST